VDDVDYVVLDDRYGDALDWKQQYFRLGYAVETEEAGLIIMTKSANGSP